MSEERTGKRTETHACDLIRRQDAIDALIRKMKPHDNGEGTMTIYVMSERLVKETLNDLPVAQQERCEDCENFSKTRLLIPQPTQTNTSKALETLDCISRQAAIEIVDRYNKSHMILQGKPMLGAASIVIELDALPSAEPEREKGTWTNDASCPFCGFQPWYERDIHTLSYCPNCGADMRGEQDE